ncbi:MAG: diguanylate cyclase, partial [Magnetovibrio sp.]|nr:diguanylate cyclase [Magnetovibrio sp.]
RGGRTLGVVVVKFPLILLERSLIGARSDDVFAVADSNGVIFDASQKDLLLRTLTPLRDRIRDTIRRNRQYGNAALKALEIVERKNLGSGQLISLKPLSSHNKLMDQESQRLIYQSQPVPGTQWTVIAWDGAAFTHDDIGRNMVVTFLAFLIVFAVFILIRQRKLFLESVYDNAIRDPLTGLYTRLYANEEVPRLMRRHDERGDSNIAAIFFDIDHFKKVNDTFGHGVGDDVLRDIGGILLAETRAIDIAIRLGGEELALIMPINDLKIAIDVAERIRRKIEKTTFGRGSTFQVTISGGVVMREPLEKMDTLFERGDTKLYQAKEQGRNRIIS